MCHEEHGLKQEIRGVAEPHILTLTRAAFAASGSVWGPDPYTGRVRPGTDWPNAADWRSEAGFSVMYRSR